MHAAKRGRGNKFLNREEKLDPEGRYWSPLEMLDICIWTEQNIAEHDYAKEKEKKKELIIPCPFQSFSSWKDQLNN